MPFFLNCLSPLIYAFVLALVVFGVIFGVMFIKDIFAGQVTLRLTPDMPGRRGCVGAIGEVMIAYTLVSIFWGKGIDILAALIGTLGLAYMLYSVGRDDMLNTIIGYFKRWKS